MDDEPPVAVADEPPVAVADEPPVATVDDEPPVATQSAADDPSAVWYSQAPTHLVSMRPSGLTSMFGNVHQQLKQAYSGHHNGRKLQLQGLVESAKSGLEDLLCFGSEDGTPVFKEYDINIIELPLAYPLVPIVLQLVGQIRAGVVISADIAGRLCLLKKSADVSITPMIALEVACELL